jgi:hypothetical protein
MAVTTHKQAKGCKLTMQCTVVDGKRGLEALERWQVCCIW